MQPGNEVSRTGRELGPKKCLSRGREIVVMFLLAQRVVNGEIVVVLFGGAARAVRFAMEGIVKGIRSAAAGNLVVVFVYGGFVGLESIFGYLVLAVVVSTADAGFLRARVVVMKRVVVVFRVRWTVVVGSSSDTNASVDVADALLFA